MGLTDLPTGLIRRLANTGLLRPGGAPVLVRRAALVIVLLASSAIGIAAVEPDWFVDRTADIGLDFVHLNGMSGRLYYLEVVGAGGALLDYDNDGDLDVYLVQGGMLGADRTLDDSLIPWGGERPPRDRLFRNQLVETGQLRFIDVTEASGLRAFEYGMGAATGDFDNDGWIDLYLLDFGKNQLWRNRGDGTFEELARQLGVDDDRWSVSASFADYDNDGWLDLYVVNYLEYSFFAHKTCLTERGEPDYCLPAAYPPAADRLYRNLGGKRFADVSQTSGIGKVEANGLGVVSADFDRNGRLDFYVANDLMPNLLWLQRRPGIFEDDGLVAGVAVSGEGKSEASMGVTAGDYDADGDLDLFLTHFRRETNTLYRDQAGIYDDATTELGLATPSWPFTSFGTGFFDYDSDGWLDLVVANGAVTFVPGTDRKMRAFPLDERNQLFRNVGGKRFEDVTEQAGAAFELSEVSRAVLLGDLDNDGDIDMVITNNSGPARVLVNEVGGRQGWLGVRPMVSTGLGEALRDANGAVLTLRRPDRPDLPDLVRRAQTDGGYASANDPRVVFGLSPLSKREKLAVEVLWPTGERESFGNLETGGYHLLVRGKGATE